MSYSIQVDLPSEERTPPRCPTPQARSNYYKSRAGTVGLVMNWQSADGLEYNRVKSPPGSAHGLFSGKQMEKLLTEHLTSPPLSGRSPKARVKPEGEENAALNSGKRMERLVVRSQDCPLSSRTPARVKWEAKENADLDKGKRMEKILFKNDGQTSSRKEVPRVKTEGHSNYSLDMGKRMENILHRGGQPRSTPRQPPRVKPEATANADLDKGKRMEKAIQGYVTQPLHSQSLNFEPRPRVKPEAEENSNYGRNGLVKYLLNNYGHLMASPRPVPRVKSAALKNAVKSRGVVHKTINQIGMKQIVPKLGA